MKNVSEMVEEERRVMSHRGYQPKSYAILKKPVATTEEEQLQLENIESFDQFNTPRGCARPSSRNHINNSNSQNSARPHSHSQQRHFINNIWGGQVPPPP